MKEISFVGFSFENLGVMIEIEEEGIFGKKVILLPFTIYWFNRFVDGRTTDLDDYKTQIFKCSVLKYTETDFLIMLKFKNENLNYP